MILNKLKIKLFVINMHILLFLPLSNCNNVINKNNLDSKSNEVKKKNIIKSKNNKTSFYTYSNDTIEQRIFIKDINDDEIEFKYIVENKILKCKQQINGIAINKYPEMDPELDEDEEGFGYPVIEYFYQYNDCAIYIRRAMIKKNKIQIKTNCKKFVESCPIASIGILKVR
jgi:hypothetical protein